LPFTNNYSFEVNQIIKIFIITIVTVFTSILTVSFIRTYSNKNKKLKETSSILIIITRIVVFLTGLLIILDIFGINITPILTAMGVGGLAVALAMQDTLSNFFAGIQILISKNINAGDFICLESGEEGFITDITWRSTTVRALSNKLIIVPNSKLTASQIINFDLPDSENAVLVDIGVSYNSDLKKVENVVTAVATHIMKTIEGGNPEFTPFIRYHTFGDFSINFNVIMRVKKYTDHYLVKHEFIKAIHERFTAENIEIPFPVRSIKMS
ncbi:MAG: mechanosensitive ion channel family protein, partial [Bacteroidota bacterium]